ncbi:hypothetical protein CNO13_07350 (plasmid) [Borrelia miyamotoi]|uniref:Uncharacterized protein n=2 Tax=Borrelia miyamotoi TaxID=47466 RepID=A0ABY7VN21_9SPIR|nr:hypothetical protein [Borrelia miyamotoi]AHH05779.1 hypothetical protein BOM_1236 [Borrelia miyamotoi FR64b]WAZ71121.1 hypothetical protein O5403_05590 [Borrelia miyamotoi]WCB91067.1 hypothetical protein CNO11_07435 [Borrelia miyamotoi]WCL22198.1 hypothetical protein CNO10_07445 [Borrelia miyamotoi]WDE70458.1 hypothetical protein CNO12_07630 [Borrelia miyamotoi]
MGRKFSLNFDKETKNENTQKLETILTANEKQMVDTLIYIFDKLKTSKR